MSGGNLTRIQNNQIYDSTIQAQQKIASGSITGNLLATNLTLNSNIVILGNLTVSNSYSQLNSVNTYINDPIVVFNNGYAGSISGYDIGILVNRNLASLAGYGSVNTFFGWSESDLAFEAIATTETGTGISSINNSGYANLIVGRISASSASITNNLTAGTITGTPISGSTGSFTTEYATNFSTANAQITGGNVSVATVTATTGNLGTLNTTTGNVTNLTVTGTLTAAAVSITGMIGNANVSMYEYVQSSSTNSTFYPAFYSSTTTGNYQAFVNSTLNFNPSTGVLTAGSLTGTNGTFTTLVSTNFSTGNARISGGYADNFAIGANTAATGAFTTLATSANINLGGDIVPSSDLTYSLGDSTHRFKSLYVGGSTIYVGSATIKVDTNGNLNLTTTGGTVFSVAGSTSTNNEFNANVKAPWFLGSVEGSNVNGQTVNAASLNATTAGLGTAVVTNLSSGNVSLTGGKATGLTAISATTAQATNFSTGNALITSAGITTLVATNFSTSNAAISGGYSSFGTLEATNFSTGNALITGGDINSLTTLNAATAVFTNLSSGNITGTFYGTTYGTATSANVAFLVQERNATDNATYYPQFGNVAGANAAIFTNTGLTFNPSTGVLSATNFNGTGSFTTEVATNFSSGNALITGGAINSLTTLSATTATATNFSTGNALITNAGVTTLVATNFSTANAKILGGTIDSTTVGATTAASGKFTTLHSTDNTNSTAVGTGALVVENGGASVSQDLWVGGNIYAGNLISQTTSILEVLDPLVYLSASNPGTYNYEIGFYSHYVGPSPIGYNHTGFIRNHVDSEWYLFSNIAEPSGGVVGLSNVNIIYDTLNLGTLLVQNTTPSTSTTTGAVVVKGGVGIAGNLNAGAVTATNGSFTTLYSTNFSTANLLVGTTYLSSSSLYVQNISSANILATSGSFDTLIATTGFSTPNAVITNSSVTTEVATNFSTGNAVITGGTGSFTTLQATNFSTANAVLTSSSVTTEVATNFSSGNAVVTGGSVNGIPIGATSASTGKFTSVTDTGLTATRVTFAGAGGLLSDNSGFTFDGTTLTAPQITGSTSISSPSITDSGLTSGRVTYAGTGGLLKDSAGLAYDGSVLSAGNVSVANDITTGTFKATTAILTNVSSGNAVITGGYLQGLANVRATEGYFTNLSTGNLYGLSGLTVTNLTVTTEVATNFSSGNVLIAGGDANGLTTLNATTAVFTNLSSANVLVTGGSANGLTTLNATTAVFTNLSSANAVVAGGSVNGTPIGATTASTGRFTSVTSTGVIISAGNLVANSGTASSSTTTGALVVKGGIGVSGAVYAGGDIHTTGTVTADSGFVTGSQIDLNLGSFALFQNPDGSDTLQIQNTGAAGQNRLIISTNGTTELVVVNNSGDLIANSSDQATSAGAGALQVPNGGAYIGGNLIVNSASIFNDGKHNHNDVIARGANDTTLVWARPDSTYDQVVIGGSATASTLVRGAKLIVNSSDSMIIPVGANSDRPGATGGIDTVGMLRYNTTSGGLEYYTGAAWVGTSTTFTIIVEQQFSGDGSTTDFTLSQAATTASVIVSINGVLQIGGGGYAYTVTGGTTLHFTEAPASTDIIDVRILTTTQQVTAVSSSNSYMSVSADNNGVYIHTGTASANPAVQWIANGAEVNQRAAVTASGVTTIDSFDATLYSSAEYTVTVTDGGGLRTITKLLVAAGSASGAYIATVSTIDSAGGTTVPGTYTATNTSGTVALKFTPTSGSYSVRVKPNYQAV